MKLKGQVALITRGSRGIGLATARRFIAEGAQVVITGRRDDALQAAAAELGNAAIAVRSNILDAGDCASLFAEIDKRFGHLDIVFANAGIVKDAVIRLRRGIALLPRANFAWAAGQEIGFYCKQLVSRARKLSHPSSCVSVTYSSGLCATSMSPGPQTTVGTDRRMEKRPPSVPNATLRFCVSGGSRVSRNFTASLATCVSRPG